MSENYFQNMEKSMMYIFLETLIQGIDIMFLFFSRKQRGFGFVEFAKREDAEEALEQLNGHKMGDRPLEVQIAQNRRKKPEDFRNNRRTRRYSRSRSHSRHGHSHSHHHHSHRRSHSGSRGRRY